MIGNPTSWLAVDTALAMSSTAANGTRTSSQPVSTVWVYGEVDLATHRILSDALDRVVADHVPATAVHPVLVDVSAMVFCDAAGLAILMQATAIAADRGIDLAVIGLAPRLVTLCATLWPGPQPAHYASIAAAAGTMVADRHCELPV